MATILIVDDDAAMREGLAETLSDLGHRAVEAPDGNAALAIAARERLDAVLLDLRILRMDGLEILRQLRSRPGAPPVGHDRCKLGRMPDRHAGFAEVESKDAPSSSRHHRSHHRWDDTH
jgi:CheY-like chemotaxis protein